MDEGEPAWSLDRMRAEVLTATQDPRGGADAVARVCRGCVDLLAVDGASISVIGDTAHRETLFASDDTIARVESLQSTLGEGPCYEAYETLRPVLVPDIAAATVTRWPVFAAEITDLSIGAIFAFPIQHGAIHIGAMDLYRHQPGWLTDTELATALQVVDLAAMALLGTQSTGEDTDGTALEAWLAPLPRNRADVHQATGMLIAALGVPADQALSRLRGYAFTTGRLVEDVAKDIVTRRIDPAALET